MKQLEKEFGLERLLFITITFRHRIKDFRIVSKVMNRLNARVLSYYAAIIKVVEEHDSGALHVYLVAVAAEDVRSGYNFARRNGCKRLPKGNAALTAERAKWRRISRSYSLIGRIYVEPCFSANDISRYLGEDLSAFSPRLKNCRRVTYSQRFSWSCCRLFSWANGLARDFRRYCQSVLGDHDKAHAKHGEELPRLAMTLWQISIKGGVALAHYRNDST